MVLGKYWPYVTPDYLYRQLDFIDVKDMAAFLTKEEWAYCWVGGKQDLTELDKLGVINIKR